MCSRRSSVPSACWFHGPWPGTEPVRYGLMIAGIFWAATAAAAGAPRTAEQAVDHVNVPVPEHHSTILANGMKLILVPRHDIPLVAFDLLLRGGARLDPPGRAGTAALVADLLTHGAGARDAAAF